MINLDTIKKDMARQLEIDKGIQSVEVRADTVEEALADAAVQFETKVGNLEYEIVEKGFKGVAGIAKKPWVLKIYQNPDTIVKKVAAVAGGEGGENGAVVQEENLAKDGVYFIHRFASDIFLKVVLPQNGGASVNANEILNDLKRPDTLDFDEGAVKEFAAAGTDEQYVKIGSYQHVPANDALFVIDVADNEMTATATISPPSMGGADISADQIEKAVESQGVLQGISREKISALVDSPIYNAPVVVAEGRPPQNGKDAYIEYKFETDRSKIKATESDTGQIDFKELNLIQNVVEGTVLAVKHPAEKGVPGKTLMANYLDATDGKDISLPVGKNVKVGEDGLSIIAAVNGQVVLDSGRVCVQPVMEVAGVNLKTGGNIKFLGTVIVKGNVEDGFSVDASGNIEVSGNVGNCHLVSGGDIIVSQGIIGRDEGVVECKGSLWAKFIESTEIKVDKNVIVQESIMNSKVSAQKKIVLTGKKAQIAGGVLFATEAIVAKNIGASGAETVLSVGVDPKLKLRSQELNDLNNANMRKLEDIDLNLNNLEQQKQIRKSLPKDKEALLNNLVDEKNKIIEESRLYNEELAQIAERNRELKNVGRVYASGNVYTGVKIFIREEKDEVRSDVKNVMFYYDLESRFVKRSKYEQPNLDDLKGPDGYSSN
ncbi:MULTISPECIES: FapA family protein [Treponema]|jgi:hypothetical protein|uniref:RNA-binding protein KhpB N-terminal domain-containing protein n=1 Tax=Treponema saccharophilum DSM 2985 TaxID=907348 RepID=H7EPA2_9SPIR|nr:MULTISPECIES: FapA family protein [Treponema]EIC00735.1 protein of unknown function DUF342 [Treponema saccharophilum DSM 2985]MBQ5537672.1 FapA family protein [Treponema sp.]BDC95825.1 polymerase [Treponema saccharophilum]